MKIWRVNNHHSSSNVGGNKNTKSTSSNDVVILGGTTTDKTATKQQRQQQQQQQSTKTAFEMKDSKVNIKNSNHRMPSLLFLSSEPNPSPAVAVPVVDDARNDTTTTTTTTNALESSPNAIVDKKEMRKQNMMMMNMGRSNHKKNSHHPTTSEATLARKSSSSRRELPEGEVATSTTNTNTLMASPLAASMTPSSTLSRLLFNKQHMEQLEQMKVVYTQFGPSAMDLLTIEPDDGIPSPEQADHVVVKVQASTVTLDDCLIRRGFDFNILDPICLPQTPGYDIVGHICVRGSKVDPTFDEGDRVAALIRTGGNSRFVSIPSSHLVKIPRNIDSAEAVAMVSTFTTAYQTLKRIKQQGPMFSLLGKRVLILGGMDGVGQALIQMCLKARAEIYAPCPKACHNYMQNVLGAHPLPEDKDQWLLLVESQMDYVFDGVCEDGLETSQKALTADGELVCYGHTSMLKETEMGIFGAPLSAHMNKLWSQTKSKAKTIDIWESYKEDPETYKKNLKSLCQLLKWNKIKPNITCRVGLSEVAAAQSKLENGELHGTIVCLPWSNVDNNK